MLKQNIYIVVHIFYTKRGFNIMAKKSVLDWIALILVIIGGLNWGLVGLFSYNVVNGIFGIGTVTTIIYVLVGLSALYMIYYAMKD
jgi:uncharacterized membrane protein YuzA (DUF378 family)